MILHRAILKAINLISKRIPVAQANNNHLRIMQGHFTLVPFFIYLGQNKVANIHLLESEVLAKRLNNEKILKTISDLRNLINYIVL